MTPSIYAAIASGATLVIGPADEPGMYEAAIGTSTHRMFETAPTPELCMLAIEKRVFASAAIDKEAQAEYQAESDSLSRWRDRCIDSGEIEMARDIDTLLQAVQSLGPSYFAARRRVEAGGHAPPRSPQEVG